MSAVGHIPTFSTMQGSAPNLQPNGGTGGSASVASIPRIMDNGGTGAPGGGLLGGIGDWASGIGGWVGDLLGKLNVPWPDTVGGLFGGASGALLEMAKDALIGLVTKYGGGPGRSIVDWAKTQIGKPYLWGATGPDAYDCSGLIYRAYAAMGHPFPTRANWWNYGTRVSPSRALPGDVMFGSMDNSQGAKYGHVKMYAGDNMTIESAGGGVHMAPADWGWEVETRRYLANGGFTNGPRSGSRAVLHGPEMVLPLNNPTRAQSLVDQAGYGGRNNVTISPGAVVVTITGTDPGGTVTMERVESAIGDAFERLAREIKAS
jgi:hypothetical protein